MSATDSYYVARTMQTVELLAFDARSATEVADALHVVARTARRLLRRLVDEEYASCDDRPASLGGRRYTLSLRLLALAGHALARTELPRVAAPFISELHGQTGHTAHLVIPSYDRVLCLAHADNGIEALPAVRELAPCHCTAGGKALLAERLRWQRAVLSGTLEAFTAHTETDPEVLHRELSEIAVRGYAIEADEYRTGRHGVAAVVRTETGEAVASIALTAAGALDSTTAARHVIRIAAGVSSQLAGRGA